MKRFMIVLAVAAQLFIGTAVVGVFIAAFYVLAKSMGWVS